MKNKSIILEAKNISKKFISPKTVDVLQNINLQMKQGDSVAITGRSGEGKTTLLHILGTLEAASTGDLVIAGQSVHSYNCAYIRNQHIGFIFQSFHLLEHSTALENVLMPAMIGRKATGPQSLCFKQAESLLQRVGLEKRSDFRTKLLSGGEKQRTAIARALMNNPSIILADEPTGNLDFHTSQQIEDLLFSCAEEQGKALVIVTHDQALAKRCLYQYQLQDGILTLV